MELQKRKKAGYVLLLCIGIGSIIYIYTHQDKNVLSENEGAVLSEEDVEIGTAIYTVEDYLDFVSSINAGRNYEGQYVNLYADLDFSGVTDGLIAGSEENTQYRFEGIFDGNGHHMKNLVIQSDTDAGLFRNLNGIVCNLEIESGSITGTNCGAVASNTLTGAYVLNCSSQAEVHGATTDGLVGISRGKIQNCSSPYEEKSAEALNQGLCGLGGSYKVDGWCFWDSLDGRPVLSQRIADTLDSISTDLRIDMKQMKLYAYYSELEEAWCFALPAGYEDTSLDVQLHFINGEIKKIHRSGEIKEVSCEMDSVVYPIKFLKSSNVPALMLDVSSTDVLEYLHEDKMHQLAGTFMLLDTGGRAVGEGRLDKIRGHGNDSWKAPKKSYNLSFHEEQDLLQMGAAKNYVLLAGYRDNSLLAYKVTNDLTKEIGMDFAPESRFVHLYLSGNYMGMYLLSEKIEVGDSRFQIKNMAYDTGRLNSRPLEKYERQNWRSSETKAQRTWFELENTPDDVSGGYILELDNEDFDREKSNFVSDRNLSFMLRSMPYASREQVDYIAGYWQEFEDALYSEDGFNRKGKYYGEYIDIESFADQWLCYELNEENSVNSSVYFYKDSDLTGDGLLHASWPWDMEHSLARGGGASISWFATAGTKPEGYWMQFYSHKDFAKLVYEEWMEKFLPAINRALQKDGAENPEGISSLVWYLEEYREDGRLNNSRWLESDYEAKLEKIRYIYTIRKEFLTKALALYESEYKYFYEEGGVLYGVTASGKDVPLEEQAAQ